MQQPDISIETNDDVILAWCKPIEDELYLLENVFLNETEKVRLQGMTANRRRSEWLTTRWLLQNVLPGNYRITYHENGKPEINNGEMSISVSHCKEVVAIVISKSAKAVGLDCETIASRILKIKHKFVNEDEFSQFKNNELENLTLIWSAKEALFKIYAKGAIDFNEHLHVNNFDFCAEGGTFTGTITKEQKVSYTMHYKLIQNSLLVWVTE